MEGIMSKKFCSECGAELTSDTGFCPKCGAITESVDKERIKSHYEEQDREKRDNMIFLFLKFPIMIFILVALFILILYMAAIWRLI